MKRTLQELTIKDDFLFGAVMLEEANCRRLLELAAGISVGSVEVSREKSFVYHPEYRGVRLDVYAKDEKNTRYNVEMQVVKRAGLVKRARYYRSQMDMDLLLAGYEYEELPETYVIFICDFDPFDAGLYRYTFESRCREENSRSLGEGCRYIFLSTYGRNEDDVPEALVKFLDFVHADFQTSQGDFQDDFVSQLQRTVQKVKESRDMEERFMTLEELLKDKMEEGRSEGRAEGRKEGRKEGMSQSLLILLQARGSVSEKLEKRITSEQDAALLEKWLKLAAAAESVEQFEREM